jgi:hypothetical protein
MGFLNNSGDIILDAVLTDEGRARLARGDGSFKIVKYALGDDEINYRLFDGAAATSQQTLSIEQTPILEAFTNNASSMKSKLITIPRNPGLYLPVIKVNDKLKAFSGYIISSGYVIAADKTTSEALTNITYNATNVSSLTINGQNPATDILYFDQGIDTPVTGGVLTSDLLETQYVVELDNRLGVVVSPSDMAVKASPYVDDDEVATYLFADSTDIDFFENNSNRFGNANYVNTKEVINGPNNTKRFRIKIQSTPSLQTSNYYFDKLGLSVSGFSSGNWKAIRSVLTVYGGTTGYSVSVPIAFLKKTA